jgi:CRP/FNR family cyclic AMP-dependent transcriptional regulator
MNSNFPIFPELKLDDLQLVAGYGVHRNYPKNTILVSEGDPSDLFYIILSGKVKVFLSDEKGKEVLLTIQGPDEYFGELALIDEAPRSASVMTLEACQMAVVSRAGFERCLEEHPGLAMGLIRSLVKRVRALTEHVKDLALLDVYGRVANTLSHMACARDGLMVIEQRLTHQDIANMVGASREMVSRIMKDLSTGGYIRLEDKRIVIPGKFPASW